MFVMGNMYGSFTNCCIDSQLGARLHGSSFENHGSWKSSTFSFISRFWSKSVSYIGRSLCSFSSFVNSELLFLSRDYLMSWLLYLWLQILIIWNHITQAKWSLSVTSRQVLILVSICISRYHQKLMQFLALLFVV